MSELSKRVAVALIGIPFAIFVILIGGVTFGLVIIIISSLALWEFYSISEKKEVKPFKIFGIVAGIIFQLIVLFKARYSVESILLTEIMLFVIGVLLFQLFSTRQNSIFNISTSIAGFLYLPVLFSSLIGLREINNYQWVNSNINLFNLDKSNLIGAYLVLGILISVWICDSAAYFIGSKWGRHKLYPRISPKKSWEGAIAGFVFSIISFILFMHFTIPNFPIIHSIAIGLIIGIFGQIGDLAESQLKRDAGVKDSSSILPGHGGVLDRFDSILFISPLVYLYITYIL